MMRGIMVSFLMFAMGCSKANTIDVISDYFAYKNIKLVCCVTCSNAKWLRDLSVRTIPDIIRLNAVTPESDWPLIKTCMLQKYASVGVIIDMRCGGASRVLQKCSEERKFDAMHYWVILDLNHTIGHVLNNSSTYPSDYNTAESLESNKNLIDVLQSLNISVDAEITTVSIKDKFGYDLFDIFNFGKVQGGNLNVTSLGDWTIQKGLNVWLNDFKYHRRWDFHNLSMRAITVMLVHHKVFTPEMLTGYAHTPGVADVTKISSMIVDLFREKHNFRYNYTIADRWVGSPERNSTLAVTNSMFWREQDISLTSVRMIPAWLDWMDILFPQTTYVETKFFYRISTEGIGDFENNFLKPFSSYAWICILCTCIICSAVLTAAARVETRPKAMQFAVFSVIAIFCQQVFEDGANPPATNGISGQSCRGTLLVSGFSSLLLYNYYTSSVVSWLLSAPPPTIASLDELISSSLEVVFEDIGYARSWLEIPGYYLAGIRSPKEDKLREKKAKCNNRKQKLLQPVDEGIELVKRGGFAYHTEPTTANMRIGHTFTQKELCNIGSLQMMPRTPVYVVGQKHSPYREFFVWSMLRALERGHVSCIRRRVHITEPKCAGSTPRALALGGASPAFMLLFFGYIASLLVMLGEILFRRLLEEQNSRSNCQIYKT